MPRALTEPECEMLAECFGLFASPTRLRLFCALQDDRRTVSQLARHAGVSLQNASQHLRILRGKGVVRTEKCGQRVYYTVVSPRFAEAAQAMRAAMLESMEQATLAVTAGAGEPITHEGS